MLEKKSGVVLENLKNREIAKIQQPYQSDERY